MENIFLGGVGSPVSDEQIRAALKETFCGKGYKKILLLPPDITRFNSYAGVIADMIYELLPEVEIDVMPALGTHFKMTEAEAKKMYPAIPYDRFIEHKWREDVVKLGEVPADYVNEISEGYMSVALDVEVNKLIMDKSYDRIISIGQVVPHEVVGMANYLKNVFVGCGGASMINYSHYLGALYGMERMMGRDHSPVHKVFDYAYEHYLQEVPITFVLTVTSPVNGKTQVDCVSIGSQRDTFEKAIEISQKRNLDILDKPLKKVVVYLDPEEFRTTWLGNKSIYRTRMVIADGGELIVLAPGVHGCGEDPVNDVLIRKYGYVGRDRTLAAVEADPEMKANLSVAAHMIHGSSEDRFTITYCAGGLTKEEVESIHFNYMDCNEAMKKYDITKLKDGFNVVDGEEIFYISNPALGLWADKERFFAQQ